MTNRNQSGERVQRTLSPPARRLARAARTLEILTRLGGVVSTVLIIVVLGLTAANVIARYIVSSPIPGVDEATGFMVVAIVMFGAAEAYRTNDHIRIDLLLENLAPAKAWWLEAFSHAAVLVFALFLMVTAWHTVAFSRAFEAYSSGYLELPLWLLQLPLIIGAVLLALIAALRLVQHLGSTVS
jgi:C4-dicarboxylate transporter, DctQ subunit